jgi:hypothetical protein
MSEKRILTTESGAPVPDNQNFNSIRNILASASLV